jgi:hypothetical protein
VRRLVLVLTLLLIALPLAAATKPYHLELEAYPAAPFPFLNKFGTVTLHVYDGGVRAETLWLNAFSKTGAAAVTVMNPLGRMYADMPVAHISPMLSKLAGNDKAPERISSCVLLAPVKGKVRGIDAQRFRLSYGADAWIDVWTTTAVPENAQLRGIVNELVRGLAPGSASAAKNITGTPVYVELNFRRFKKVPVLKLKSLAFDNAGAADALNVGALYMKSPMGDSLWK